MELQMYADDTQIYLSICPVTPSSVQFVSEIEVRLAELREWIVANFLKIKGGRKDRSDKVSLWCVSLLINTRFRFFLF